jgi:hypothetical protein
MGRTTLTNLGLAGLFGRAERAITQTARVYGEHFGELGE